MNLRRSSNVDLKVVVLGSSNVGKTSVINRYCNGTFIEETRSTIGAGFFTHSLTIDDYEVTIMLWDTAGEERFRSVAPSLLRGANGLIIVFDVTQKPSFDDIDLYLDMFLDHCKVEPDQEMPVLLLGNKADLDGRVIPEESIEKWKKKNNVSYYYEVSAKTGMNIEKAIEELVHEIVIPQQSYDSTPIKIDPTVQPQQKSCC